MLNFKVIAVDFDGTLCENKWPKIGEPNNAAIDYLKQQQKSGAAKLILWTCRTGDKLTDAINWCADHGLKFDAVNRNAKEAIEEFGEDTRKVFADEYIDDKSSHQFDLPFIKRKMGITDEIIRKLELVVGFPLYDWQKRYLKGYLKNLNNHLIANGFRTNSKKQVSCSLSDKNGGRLLEDHWSSLTFDFSKSSCSLSDKDGGR